MPRKRRAPAPRTYPDQDRDYGEAESLVGAKRLHEAGGRSDTMHRALALLRGRIAPARYESYLGRLSSAMRSMDSQAIRAADRAQLKLHDVEDDLARLLCEDRHLASPPAEFYSALGEQHPEEMAQRAAVAAEIRDVLAARGVGDKTAMAIMDVDEWDLWHVRRLHVRWFQTDALQAMREALVRAVGEAPATAPDRRLPRPPEA